MKKILTKKLESLQKAVFHYSAYAISVYSAAETIAAINTPNTREVVTGALLCILAAALPAVCRYRKTPVNKAFAALLLLILLKTAAQTVIAAATPDTETAAIVFFETVMRPEGALWLLLGFLLVLSLFAYNPQLSYTTAAAGTAAYATAALLSGEATLKDSFLLIFTLFASCALMEHYIIKEIRSLMHDNRRYLAERRSLFSLFNIDDGQVSQFIRLLRKRDLTPGQTEQLLKLLGDETERRIRQSVLHLMQHRQTDYSKLDERLPSLTATERKVACLVLQGKTHPEIARELLKSPSNVSVIRSNIRRKMGLGPKDNLAECLRALMQEPERTERTDEAPPANLNALSEQQIPITK